MDKILITGGSGLIGKHLTRMLLEKGYEVVHLSRRKNLNQEVKVFVWDYEKNYLEEGALVGVNHIIHLAGASIGDGRWTKKRKKEIVDSRVKTAELLFKKVKEQNILLKSFISASGISYYGTRTVNKIFSEEDICNDIDLEKDFAANCVVQWEKAVDEFQSICRVAKLRTGIVLDKNDGALKKIYAPMRWGFGAAVGRGKQVMPWIHIDDICKMYLFILENNLSGVFNGVAPEVVSNKEFTKQLAKTTGKKLWLPNVPSFVLKIMFGEMAKIVLEGSSVSCRKIMETGFEFQFEKLNSSLNEIYKIS